MLQLLEIAGTVVNTGDKGEAIKYIIIGGICVAAIVLFVILGNKTKDDK